MSYYSQILITKQYNSNVYVKKLLNNKNNNSKFSVDQYLTLNDAGGGVQNDPMGTDKACMPSIFITIFFEKLRMIEIGPRGR